MLVFKEKEYCPISKEFCLESKCRWWEGEKNTDTEKNIKSITKESFIMALTLYGMPVETAEDLASRFVFED